MASSNIAYFIILMLATFAAAMLVFTKNLFHASLGLMLLFLSIAALYVLLGAEFVAVGQIVIYVGGVLILLVFGILLTNRVEGGKALFATYRVFPSILISATVLLILWQIIGQLPMPHAAQSDTDVIPSIGTNLMTTNIIPFELIAVLLLISLVGAAYIIKPGRP